MSDRLPHGCTNAPDTSGRQLGTRHLRPDTDARRASSTARRLIEIVVRRRGSTDGG